MVDKILILSISFAHFIISVRDTHHQGFILRVWHFIQNACQVYHDVDVMRKGRGLALFCGCVWVRRQWLSIKIKTFCFALLRNRLARKGFNEIEWFDLWRVPRLRLIIDKKPPSFEINSTAPITRSMFKVFIIACFDGCSSVETTKPSANRGEEET